MQQKNITRSQSPDRSLTSLDKDQLIDLLQDKTKLLIDARSANILDKVYIDLLRKEVEDIQFEIKSRMN
jgi:hypothetical protein